MRTMDVLAICSGVLLICVSCEEGKATPSPASKAHAESTLYQTFEGGKLMERYSPRFESVSSGGSRSNVTLTPPGEMFRDFSLRGKISTDKLKPLLTDLKADLLSLAKASGVEIVQEPREMGAGRLDGLPYAPFKTEYAGSLQGFHFTYRQGSIVGAVDVLAGSSTGGAEKEWMLVCSVHEATR